MGGWLSYLWWGGDPDTVNPISGLTRREIYAVQRTWALVHKDSTANGIELLKRLFRAYPETKEFFKMVRKLPEVEYEKNFQFKAHVINLMSSLDQAIKTLDQPEIVIEMMLKLGASHRKRQLQEQQFYELKDVLGKMLIDVLKPDSTTLAAWAKTVDFWYKHIFVSLSGADGR